MTQTITEPKREIPVIAEADVVIAGGGPGGFPAAIAAARHGASVIMIERYGFLGGLATAGLVAPILAHTASRTSRPIVEGVLRQLTERMHEIDGAPSWEETLEEQRIRFNPEALKFAADRMVEEAGVEMLLHTFVADVIMEDGKIAALVIESKSGRQAVRGKVFIDATGDADVAFRSGAPFRQGRDFDGAVESMGSFIHIGGIDDMTDEQKKAGREKIIEALNEGRLKFYNPNFNGQNSMERDYFSPNMTRFSGDPTNVRDLTEGELSIRRDVWTLVKFLKEEVPGCENAYIRQTSPQIGPRESRQIVGDYVLTGEDIRQGSKFEDSIARGSWWIDIHCPLGQTYPMHLCTVDCPMQEECPFWAAEHDNMYTREGLYPPDDDWYDIPYRCITPQKVDNLLVSGRAISATHEGMAGARVMATCAAIGHAAGVAAAIAAREGVAARDLDVQKLRQTLKKDGALV